MDLGYIQFTYFMLYSVLGWCCEVVYCSVPAGHFINRGMLAGPYCPIYGFGALIVIDALMPFEHQFWAIFIFGMIATTMLEYVTHFLMEKLLHMKLWDYSEHRFNIRGRVCLLNSVLFGFLCLIVMYVIHPLADRLIGAIPSQILPLISLLLFGLLVADITTTLHTLSRLKYRLRRLREIGVDIQDKLGQLEQEKWAQFVDVLERELKRTSRANSLLERRFMHAFPNMNAREFQNQLDQMRAAIDERHQYIIGKKQQIKQVKADLKADLKAHKNK